MTAYPKDGALVSPVQPAPPSERSPERLEGNPVPPQLHESMRGGTGPKTPGTQGGGEPTRVPGQPVPARAKLAAAMLAPGMAKLAAAMSEGELDRSVRRIAADLGLLVYHTHDSRRSEPGFPDLVLVGRRGVMYRELKKENGRLTQAQKTWLAALRDAEQDAGVWRPSDLIAGRVARELAALAGMDLR